MPLHYLQFILLFITITAVERGLSDLNKLSSCTCLNDDIIYTCAVSGLGFTIWRGSAFDCSAQQDRILLRHMSFESGTMGSCNGGNIVGRSLGVSENVYSSQITVFVTPNLIGGNIECAYSLTGATVTSINSTTITISEPFPSPVGVKLMNVTTDHLTFQWDPVEFGSSCPTLQYSIETDCGNCSTNPQSAISVICTFDLSSVIDDVCSFSVRTVICGDTAGNFSVPINIMLKVPTLQSVDVVPTYTMAGNLSRMNITFRELDSYRIFDEIDGSILYYNLTFVDSSTQIICNTTRISPSSCSNGICTIIRNLSELAPPCSGLAKSGDIMIAVSASNVLGIGPTSRISVGHAISQYVDVTFEQVVDQGNKLTRIVCIFSNETNIQSKILCKIEYKPCQEQNMTFRAFGVRNSSNTVIINLLVNLQLKMYCYTITASNGSYTILIEDNTVTSSDPSVTSTKSRDIAIGILVPVAVIIVIALMIVGVLVTLKVQRTKGDYNLNHGTTLGEGVAAGEGAISGEDATKAPLRVKAHICFNLEDKPNQLLSALRSLLDQEIKFNIKNIKIGPLKDEMRRIYIENENQLSETDRDVIKKKIAVDGQTPEELEIFLKSKFKSISTRTEDHDQTQVQEITEILEHQSGELCGLIDDVLSINDCVHINITDITIEDEGTKHKRVAIKFVSAVNDTWKEQLMKRRATRACT